MLPGEIKQLRTSLGLNQGEFAYLMGVHIKTAGKWEKGLSRPDMYKDETLTVYATVANIPKVKEHLPNILLRYGAQTARLFLLQHTDLTRNIRNYFDE